MRRITRPGEPGRYLIVCTLLAVLAAGFIAAPVAAGERYVSGSPNLSAAVQGSNEFSPGDDVLVPVSVQNSGLLEYVYSYPNIITRVDLPNTAKLMVVSLGSGSAPVSMRSDAQMVGDLAGGGRIPVSFRVQIAPDAPAGTYNLPLRVRYTYLREADQYGLDVVQYFYDDKDVEIPLTIRILPRIVPEVESVKTEHLNVGTEGYVRVSLKNTGNENGRDAAATIAGPPGSPVVPTAGSVFIGDFPAGSVVPLQYKVMVSKTAEAFSYPLNLTVTYKDRDGTYLTTKPVTIGIPVGEKIAFSVVSGPEGVTPGSKSTWEITYRNDGDVPVYAAEARITAVDPFTTSDDTSYLGDMPPGAEKTARFEVTVDGAAVVKEYGLDSEVRYRDALDNDLISDRVTVPAGVVPVSGITAVVGSPYFIIVVIIIVAGAGYFVMNRRKKSRR